MNKKEKISNKRIRITIIVMFIISTIIIAAFFFDCIHDYSEYSEDNLNLASEELTFEKYEERHNRGGWYFDLYVKENEEPFRIDTITSKGLNKGNLSKLIDGDLLRISISQNFGEICEISCNEVVILSASDYVKANRNNEIIGMIFLPFIFLCVLFLTWVFIRAIEPITENEGLGKIRISVFLLLMFVLCLNACTYSPPEGYTEEHHTYEEVLAFAKSIDPNATVSKEYTDTTIDDWNRSFREYPAVINGIECHVSSVGDLVWNSGFLAGEFARQYYVIDTDYDYLVLKQIVAEQNPDWRISEDTLGHRYNWNNVLSIYMEPNCTEHLTDEELDAVWEQAKAIFSAYHNLPIRKDLYFWLPAPGKTYNSEREDIVKRNSNVLLEHFTEEDKLAFIDKYHEAWALLDSGLPIYD